eukprot:TRINITY_DN4806_c0_g2_i1.p1 TRINITY_DN4806_c0_g2~~TRINITY_DN4806_c0_g2_i1.p1  ORF type:complete len:331 (-),score=44.03 TRINITY_DN4806_c0_g2_i1:167-1159(-)
MEGGFVCDSFGNLIGILLPPLRRTDGSPVEYNFVAPTDCLLDILLEFGDPIIKQDFALEESFTRSPTAQVNLPALQQASRSVVLVLVGSSTWASGVIISASGYVLTNAHVIKSILEQSGNAVKIRARVDLDDAQMVWYDCDLIFSATFLDVAILKMRKSFGSVPNFAPVRIAPVLAGKGDPIHIIGHAIFGKLDMKPSCTFGVVANIVYSAGNPAVILTSAAVHSGNSGGMLVNARGEFLGLVTCNIQHQQNEYKTITVPRMNFSIPVTCLQPVFQFAQNRFNSSVLGNLNEGTSEVKALWALTQHHQKEEFIDKLKELTAEKGLIVPKL